MQLKVKHLVNLHKATTPLFVLALMIAFDNFTIAAWTYLALHGTYGILWLLKDRIYPDKQWEQEMPMLRFISAIPIISLYWVAPWILITSGSAPPPALVGLAVSITIVGIFLHFGSDAQKYFTLKYRSGLITEGFFALTRNPNYLGEILIYIGFALLAQHWLPFAILAGYVIFMFVPNMLKKDRSLARYPEFEEYKQRSGLLLPKLWSFPRVAESSAS